MREEYVYLTITILDQGCYFGVGKLDKHEPEHDKTNKMTCASSDDCAQPWASAQPDQSLRYPPDVAFCSQLPIKHTAKTQIRLGGCPA